MNSVNSSDTDDASSINMDIIPSDRTTIDFLKYIMTRERKNSKQN